MQQKMKIDIFKDIITSVTKFEDYEKFAVDKFNNSIKYALKLIAITVLLISIVATIKIYYVINEIEIEIEEKINQFEYENGELSINSNETLEKKFSDFISMYIIIDTSNINNDKKQNYIEKISGEENAIIILKNQYIIKSSLMQQEDEYSYKDILESDVKLEKNDFLMYIKGMNKYIICLMFFFIFFVVGFAVYTVNLIIYVLVFTFIGNLTSLLLRIQLTYKAILNIVIHAFTLPTLLYTLYIIVNLFFNFEIKYFQVMYIGITYIYIITAILMLKTDFIKRQIELTKIMEEQEKIRRDTNSEQENSNHNQEDIQEKDNSK